MTLRVAFPFVGDSVGGSHISAALLMAELPRLGFSPVAIVHQDGPLLTWLQARKLDYLRADLPFLPSGAAGLPAILQIFTMAPQLALFLRHNRFDLVHANDGRMIVTWMAAARLAGCKAVAHRRTRWSASRLATIGFFFAQAVIAISRYVESTLSESLRRKAIVIANPFEPPRITRAEARQSLAALVGEHGPVVAFIGTLQAQKRPDVFLRAAALMHRQRPELRFLLIGRDGDQGAVARALCRELSLDAVVTFAGFRPDAADCLAGCDLLLAPAVEEGHGRVLIEAMSVGVPVVAASSGGHLDIISPGRTGILVAPGDAQALAETGLALLSDPTRAVEIADAARLWAAAGFSVIAHAQSVAATYHGLFKSA